MSASIRLGALDLKKLTFILILAAVVVGTVLLVSVVALAAGDWHTVGETGAGDKISVSSVHASNNSLRTAWVRVEYKEPVKLPQGGPFVEMRARVRFNCASGKAVPTAEWFYSRGRGGKFVVSKKSTHDEIFGKDSEGGFGELASKSVCQN